MELINHYKEHGYCHVKQGLSKEFCNSLLDKLDKCAKEEFLYGTDIKSDE